MQILKDYKNYKKHLPEYKTWSDEQDLKNAKRNEYLKTNPDKINNEDIQRGQKLLNAIDVMDEYSQSYAEDTEVATAIAIQQSLTLGSTIGSALGLAMIMLKPIQNLARKTAIKNDMSFGIFAAIPGLIGLITGIVAAIPVINWATRAQIGASRRGRFEAMTKDLKNPAMFATLTPEQEKQIQEIAPKIELDEKDKKRLKKTKNNISLLDTYNTLKKIYKGEKAYKQAKADFDKKLNENLKKFDNPISEEQILSAKKDQQILSNMVRKIDIASQDYAENAELATNSISSIIFSGGILTGFVTDKLLNTLKIKNVLPAKIINWGISLGIPLVYSIYATKIQKQASRIARHKIKQEMTQKPTELVYVDEQNIAKMSHIHSFDKKNKLNIFKFFRQLIKDNKEYQKHIKENAETQIRKQKALCKIQLSEEQIQKAKNLQENVFKTFNKVDEKSQAYAESVEALGSFVTLGATFFSSLAILGITMLNIRKNKSALTDNKQLFNVLLKQFVPFTIALTPILLIDIFTTKEQKKASRVANMLALKDLADYRHFVDYSQKTEQQTKTPQPSSLLELLKKQNTH